MSHWAEIDDNNIVIRVVKCDNDDPNGDEGYQWLIERLGGRWIKTSYNTHLGEHLLNGTPFRKNYAGIGYIYNEELDAFIPPKPEGMDSWVLNEEKGIWEPPVPFPGEIPENKFGASLEYLWNEENLVWEKNPNWGIIE